jgi:hypothetical protein
MSVTGIFLIGFIFFIALHTISFLVLLHIQKNRYRNFYDKDSKRATVWNSYHRKLFLELIWQTPYWVKQENDARVFLWLFRLSFLFFTLSWLFIVFAGFRVIG